MCRVTTVILAVSCLAIGATGGFRVGSYLTNQTMEKRALAHSCGVLDPKTLNFSWTLQQSVGIVMDSIPEITYKKQKK